MPKDRNYLDVNTGILPTEDEIYAQNDKNPTTTTTTTVVPVTTTDISVIKVRGTGQIGDYGHTTHLDGRGYTGGVDLDLTGAIGYGAGTYFGNYLTYDATLNYYGGNVIAYNDTSKYALPLVQAISTTAHNNCHGSNLKIFGGVLFNDMLKYYDKATTTWIRPWFTTSKGVGDNGATGKPQHTVIENGYIWSLWYSPGWTSLTSATRYTAPTLLCASLAAPTTFIESHTSTLSGSYYNTPQNDNNLANSSGMCSGGGYIWVYGSEWGYSAPVTITTGGSGWWYTEATTSSSWSKHSNFATTARGALEIPAVDSNGDLWTVLTNGDVVKYGRTSGITTYSALSVWTTISPYIGSTYYRGVSVSTALTEDSGDILICGAMSSSYINSLTAGAIPCIWRFSKTTNIATVVWYDYRFLGTKTQAGAQYIKKHPSGTGYMWTVSGGTNNDTYICSGSI